MTLKINYLKKKKIVNKNKVFFVYPDTKIVEFKGKFDNQTYQKFVNFFKIKKSIKEDKIVSLIEDFDQKIIIINVVKSKSEIDFEKLGAKFFDFIKKNEINDIYFNTIKLFYICIGY